MHDIGFSRQAAYAFVSLTGEVEGLGDDVHFLAVARVEIGVEQMMEGILDHLIVGSLALLGFDILLIVHNACI